MAWPPDMSVPRAILIGLGVTVVLAVVVAGSTSGTAFSLYNTGWEGASELRAISEDAGASFVVMESTQVYARVDGSESIGFVLAPAESYTQAEVGRVISFLERGGTVVVAGDFGGSTNSLLAALDAESRLDGRVLRDERNHYRGPALPIADNVSATPLMAGVDQLTLNHGTAIEPHGAAVLVRTSPYAYFDTNEDGDLDDNEVLQPYPVVTRERLGPGTIVVVGDPSVFINTMLDQPDNGAWVQTLASTHETVILDTSHSAAIPPLAAFVLTLRESVLLQALLIIAGIGFVVAGTSPTVHDRVRDWWHEDTVDPSVSTADVRAVVMDRHPDWDPDRVNRVVEGLITQRQQEEDDD